MSCLVLSMSLPSEEEAIHAKRSVLAMISNMFVIKWRVSYSLADLLISYNIRQPDLAVSVTLERIRSDFSARFEAT